MLSCVRSAFVGCRYLRRVAHLPGCPGAGDYFRDISDRKRAEEELQRARESLRESARRKSEFLALLAHELRNPLAPIGNGLKILRLRGATDPVSDRTIEMMERQMKHLVRLVDDLLDVGRITSGKLQLRTQRVRVTDVLETAVESTRNVIEPRGHQLSLDVRAQNLTVDADPDRLVQVFSTFSSTAPNTPSAVGISGSPWNVRARSTFTVRLPSAPVLDSMWTVSSGPAALAS